MLYQIDQLQQFADNLIQEIKEADSGLKNSLAYAINQLPTDDLVKIGEVFQVLMIGGSHLESSLVRYNQDQKLEILSFYDEGLPKLATKEIVLNFFEKNLDSNVNQVCLNFAYPLKPIIRDKVLDGVLLHGVKEHLFKGFVGSIVGLELENHIYNKSKRTIKVTVCNDTTALGLASVNYDSEYNHTNTFFGVIGTGFNFGLFKSKNELVNLESGNFDKFEQSYTGIIIDSLSNNFQKQKLEKEIGGAYLVNHFNILSALEGLNENLHTTKEVSYLAQKKEGKACDLALKLYERAASLVATHIVALYKLKQEKVKTKKDFKALILLEGSLFWKGYQFKDLTKNYIQRLGIDPSLIRLDHIEKIGIKGAARLARLGN